MATEKKIDMVMFMDHKVGKEDMKIFNKYPDLEFKQGLNYTNLTISVLADSDENLVKVCDFADEYLNWVVKKELENIYDLEIMVSTPPELKKEGNELLDNLYKAVINPLRESDPANIHDKVELNINKNLLKKASKCFEEGYKSFESLEEFVGHYLIVLVEDFAKESNK